MIQIPFALSPRQYSWFWKASSFLYFMPASHHVVPGRVSPDASLSLDLVDSGSLEVGDPLIWAKSYGKFLLWETRLCQTFSTRIFNVGNVWLISIIMHNMNPKIITSSFITVLDPFSGPGLDPVLANMSTKFSEKTLLCFLCVQWCDL